MANYVLRRTGRDWTFVLLDDRGRVIVRGTPHATRAWAVRAIGEVRDLGPSEAAFVEVRSGGGLYGFCVVTPDKRRLATSSYFSGAAGREDMLRLCREACVAAPVVEDATWPADEPDASGPPQNGESGLTRGEPSVQLETGRAGHRLVLFDRNARSLLATLLQPFRAAAVAQMAEFKGCAADRLRYARHLSDTGFHSFRLVDRAGVTIATSGLYPTAREREDRLERTLAAAYLIARADERAAGGGTISVRPASVRGLAELAAPGEAPAQSLARSSRA